MMTGTASWPWVILGLLAGWAAVALAVRGVLGPRHSGRRNRHKSAR